MRRVESWNVRSLCHSQPSSTRAAQVRCVRLVSSRRDFHPQGRPYTERTNRHRGPRVSVLVSPYTGPHPAVRRIVVTRRAWGYPVRRNSDGEGDVDEHGRVPPPSSRVCSDMRSRLLADSPCSQFPVRHSFTLPVSKMQRPYSVLNPFVLGGEDLRDAPAPRRARQFAHTLLHRIKCFGRDASLYFAVQDAPE